jgi:hypothetical protein
MTFCMVVERELRVRSRRRQTYWRRWLAALITIGICMWVWFVYRGAVQHERARCSTIPASFCLFLLAGAGGAADCLSRKRDGTLVVVSHGLKGYDVSWASYASWFCYRLVAVFPVLAIPPDGGLTIGEFWRMVLVLVNTLFFAAGVFVSSISHQSQSGQQCFRLILLIAGGFR